MFRRVDRNRWILTGPDRRAKISASMEIEVQVTATMEVEVEVTATPVEGPTPRPFGPALPLRLQ